MSELKTYNSKRVDVIYDDNAENTEWFDTKDVNYPPTKVSGLVTPR